MFQRTRRLSAVFLTALIIALVGEVGECGSACANQEPSSEVPHWSIVSRPAVGPDDTIYVLGSIGDIHPPDDPERNGGWTYGPGSNYLYAVKPDGTQRWSFTLGGGEIGELFPPKIGPSASVYVTDNHNLYPLVLDVPECQVNPR
jgi:outer membrane protein assembly factor BamB